MVYTVSVVSVKALLRTNPQAYRSTGIVVLVLVLNPLFLPLFAFSTLWVRAEGTATIGWTVAWVIWLALLVAGIGLAARRQWAAWLLRLTLLTILALFAYYLFSKRTVFLRELGGLL